MLISRVYDDHKRLGRSRVERWTTAWGNRWAHGGPYPSHTKGPFDAISVMCRQGSNQPPHEAIELRSTVRLVVSWTRDHKSGRKRHKD